MQVEVDVDICMDEVLTRQTIPIESIDDFSPDRLVKKIQQIDQLLKIRNSLMMLKGPMGNIPEFRQELEKVITNQDQRKKLDQELSAVLPREAETRPVEQDNGKQYSELTEDTMGKFDGTE